jgi:hypothetical protein
MRALRLPNGNLLVPVETLDPDNGLGLAEIAPEHPEYGRWYPFAKGGEDPRPREEP